jgi:hypothetical protein|tara:strand:+ start:83 stop:1600 length:1518 start_codon:yes stop_codon:yes gene_type:complete
MREREIITEAIASEITVGFELEIVVPGARTFSSQIDDLEPGTLEQLAPQIERIVAKYGLGRMDEQSVTPNDDDLDTHFGAEFDIGLIKNEDGHTQTRLTATPPNFTKVARIVKEFLDNGAYTNETCGFHAHFGLGKLEKTSGMDTTWFTAYFIESGLFKNYQTYKGIPQYEEGEYASINELEGSVDGFRASLDNLTAKENKLAFAHQQTVDKLHMGIFDKYNVLNPHHQGTLEWRGLRGVFDNMSGQANNYNEIVDYLKFVYKFAREVGRSQNMLLDYEIGGITLRELKRFYFERKQSDSGEASNVVKIFNSNFKTVIPKEKLQQARTFFHQHMQYRDTGLDTKRFSDNTFLKQVDDSMKSIATGFAPFISNPRVWNTPESKIEPRILHQQPIFSVDAYNLGFDGEAFALEPRLWNQLVKVHNSGFINCTFEECQFIFKTPSQYKFHPEELFVDCIYTRCVAVFKTQDEADTATTIWSVPPAHSKLSGSGWLSNENEIYPMILQK